VLFLYTISIRPSLSTELIVLKCVVEAFSFTTITPELAHFRLGYVGQPTAKINYHRISEDIEGDHEFNCEPCRLAKLKKIVSYAP
jgi:hypothetical protein